MDLPVDLASLLARVDALRDEIGAMRPLTPEQAGRAMQRLRIEWTYHSNAIEGNSLTYGETRALLMHGVTAHGKPLKDHLDIRRHREVIEYLEGFVRSGEPLTLAAIREMHRMLMGDTYEVSAETPDGERAKRDVRGGEFKTLPNNVVTETGETHYYTTPQETPAAMTDLVDGLRQSDDAHPVVRAALFHHAFVEIHPFPDGNGRTARVLMNLLLMRAGYVPAVIRQEQRPAYYGALAAADGGDRQPIIEFMTGELTETMRLYLRTLRGEPDPDEFAKRVALLTRRAESVQSKVEAEEVDQRARDHFLSTVVRPSASQMDALAQSLVGLYGRVSRQVLISVDSDGGMARFSDPEFDAALSYLEGRPWGGAVFKWTPRDPVLRGVDVSTLAVRAACRRREAVLEVADGDRVLERRTFPYTRGWDGTDLAPTVADAFGAYLNSVEQRHHEAEAQIDSSDR